MHTDILALDSTLCATPDGSSKRAICGHFPVPLSLGALVPSLYKSNLFVGLSKETHKQNNNIYHPPPVYHRYVYIYSIALQEVGV